MSASEFLVAGTEDAIITYSGKVIRPLDPNPNDIFIIDIAHALSNQCRFTGHTEKFYSVAEHSWHTSWFVPEWDALCALLHDASEAYLSDIARPLKLAPGLGAVYREAEKKLEAAIAKRFDLEYPFPKTVKKADDLLLRAEASRLMPDNFPVDKDDSDTVRLMCLEPVQAKGLFMDRYKELTRESS